jgi:hypothetical protein
MRKILIALALIAASAAPAVAEGFPNPPPGAFSR